MMIAVRFTKTTCKMCTRGTTAKASDKEGDKKYEFPCFGFNLAETKSTFFFFIFFLISPPEGGAKVKIKRRSEIFTSLKA